MIRNYFIIAWRNLKKNRLTSFINIFGLTVSIGVCLLIALFIHDEINYDRFEKDYEQVYRLEQQTSENGVSKRWAASPAPLKDFLGNNFPEIRSSTRLMLSSFAYVNVGENKFKEDNCFLADSTVFDVLGLSLIHGNADKALVSPYSVVLAEKTAMKLFGRTDVLEQTVTINAKDFKVTGVLKDLPGNSHLQITLLRPITLMANESFMKNWFANALYSYVRLQKDAVPSQLTAKIAAGLKKAGIIEHPETASFQLHEISRIHLDGNVEKELSQNSSWTFVYIFVSVGFLVLLLASINYINLTTSRSLERSREIGVRKTLGAFRRNLIAQFISESVLVTLLSYIIAILLVYAALPFFNSVTGKHLAMAAVINPFFLLVSAGIIVFIGVLAGLYPAFVISSFDPVNTLKGISATNMQSRFSFGLRKSLVVLQFVISVFLVISSLVVIKQISFMFEKPLGYDKENVMVLPAYKLDEQMLSAMRNKLMADPAILGVSATSAVPGKRVMLESAVFPGQDEQVSIRTMFVDYDYMKAMNMQLAQGRYFDRSMASDSVNSVLINEAAVKAFNLKNPIGENVNPVAFNRVISSKVIGVVKDFHQGSLHNKIEPMLFILEPFYNSITIRFRGDAEAVRKEVSACWSSFFPHELFTYTILDDDLKTLYKSESTLKQLLILFTAVAIVIASLGLFGIIFFSNTLRRKEIGIRKVLGAGNGNILYLLSKEYVLLIFIALVISLPLSWYALSRWLDNFAYRTEVPFMIFVSGVAITLIITFATVFLQGMRSAMASPVKNLRTE